MILLSFLPTSYARFVGCGQSKVEISLGLLFLPCATDDFFSFFFFVFFMLHKIFFSVQEKDLDIDADMKKEKINKHVVGEKLYQSFDIQLIISTFADSF